MSTDLELVRIAKRLEERGETELVAAVQEIAAKGPARPAGQHFFAGTHKEHGEMRKNVTQHLNNAGIKHTWKESNSGHILTVHPKHDTKTGNILSEITNHWAHSGTPYPLPYAK